MDLLIDKFTPCLENTKTGEFIETSFSLASAQEIKKLHGWKFNWLSNDLK